MKISYNWLKEYIDTDLAPQDLADVLTMLGLETEGKPEKVGGIEGNLEGVVVGEVLSADQHPNADKLRVCQVEIGAEAPLAIVCGAPNVAAGQKVPVATIGTTLYPIESDQPFKIKKGKIRGEVSMGMICAEDELGLGHNHDGIMVLDANLQPGTPFNQVVELDEDYVIEIDLTPNRIDAASHYGVARDLAAFWGKKARLPEITLKEENLSGKNPIPVTIKAPDKCTRYSSLYISGVTVAESPEWLKNRLMAIGLRPRNNVVDITNYVLHELGQPMHAFDADQLEGGEIIVRTLDKDQKFVTLDEEERQLKAGSDLLICDASQPRCIAGTMGGMNSSVTTATQNIFLESAHFDAGTVRKQAKRLAINSDSSYRFERGADPNMTTTAAMRAASLIVELCGGTVSEMSDIKLSDFPPYEIALSIKRTNNIIGHDFGKDRIIEILRSLEIEISEDNDGDSLYLKVPPYRVDVQRPQDVMEEILRIYGYNNVDPAERLTQTLVLQPYQDANRLRQHYSDYLSANGYFEILNNSLVNKNLGDEKAIHILNPLSEELEVMRQSLLPGFLEVVRHNQNRQMENLALYEFGKTYWKGENGYEEKQWLSMLVSGMEHEMHWRGKPEKVSLYTLTKEVERMQVWFGIEGKLKESEHAEYAYGLSLEVKGNEVLHYGQVKVDLCEAYDLKNEAFFMTVDWQRLVKLYFQQQPKFQPIPIYPSIRRDISMMVDESVSFSEIRDVIQRANPKLIRSIELHDVYKGKNIAEGKKSYLVSIVLRDDKKTLQDKAADKIVERIYGSLTNQLAVEIRK